MEQMPSRTRSTAGKVVKARKCNHDTSRPVIGNPEVGECGQQSTVTFQSTEQKSSDAVVLSAATRQADSNVPVACKSGAL